MSHSHSQASTASTSHSHLHPHSRSHDHALANKHHSHSHSHHFLTPSALHEWTASQCIESILDSYEDWDEDTTEVLDFGCGIGLISRGLMEFSRSVVGVDISRELVEGYNTSVSLLSVQVPFEWWLRERERVELVVLAQSDRFLRVLFLSLSLSLYLSFSLCRRLSAFLLVQLESQVSNNGLDPSDMMAIQMDELKDEENELGGRLFDVVVASTCAQVYHHIKDVDYLTRALSRRLKPKGILIVIDLDNQAEFGEALRGKASKTEEGEDQVVNLVVYRGGFSKESLREMFEKTGRLEEIEVEISHTATMSQMAALKGNKSVSTKADLEIRWIICTGRKKVQDESD